MKEQVMKAVEAVQALRLLHGAGSIGVTDYVSSTEVIIYQGGTYKEATNLLQQLGIGVRRKGVIADEKPWCVLSGELAPNVEVKVYVEELPPTCHLETYWEDVPWSETITTAETVRVKRTKVVCTGGDVE